MTYTNQEKRFLEKLGITPGPWIHGATQISDMFLALFKYAIKSCGECCNNYPDNQFCIICDVKDLISPIESVTSKTFQRLLEIWESCK